MRAMSSASPFDDPRPFARARVIRAWDHADTTTVLGADGVQRRFSGDSAELVRAVLGFVRAPRAPADLLAHLAELTGGPVDPRGPVDEILALLEAAGAVRRAPATEPAPSPPGARLRVVVGITGAVAAAFAPSLCEVLLARGCDVRVVTTRNALRFTAPLALAALTHAPVVTSLWPRDPAAPVPHLDLARWAEVMVIYPASATSISRLATGSCGTVVSATAVSTRAPVLVVPSMNESMFTAPAVQRNLEQLREDGFFLAHPSCGVEVADPPAARAARPVFGSAPPVAAVVDLVLAIAAQHAAPRTAAPSWDAVYREGPAHALPWSTDTLDEDVGALLDRLDRGKARLLDLGTGLGTAAMAAADRGFFVVATDVSPRALDLARERAGGREILWIVDDVLETRLRGAFDVVLDRGLFHTVARERQASYVAAVSALVRPGGHLLLKVHAADEPVDRGTQRLSQADVIGLFGDAFEALSMKASTMPGPGDLAPKALLCALRRR
jgi:3-polyprenyl-4-hydroxybenzoate decarboxylase/predicted O-methyltransferase YrrM